MIPTCDIQYMTRALRLAQKAFAAGEVPVGAVVVYQNSVVGMGQNRVEQKHDASQHAELIAIRQASRQLKSWRLPECDLYVTLEPCAMCAGAIVWARLRRVIFGASDPKAGAAGSVLTVIPHPRLNHRPEVIPGVLAAESKALLQAFFKQLRRPKNA